MDAEQYNLVASLFERCLEMNDADREVFIADHCSSRPEIESGLRRLIAHDPGEVDQEDSRLRPLIEQAFHQSDSQDPMPVSIAGHRVIREIGRGGMGVVYEAQQTHPERRVAIKVLHGIGGGAGSEAARELMQRESSILARMESPGIARVYESGMTEVHGCSTPYLVMELIDGVRIDRFVRPEGDEVLDQRETIELIARTADAVQQAHRNGVIHRDLKPANILVVRDEDGKGRPIVLDFGVGRVLDAEPHTHTHSTGIVGTLGYLSPEQISGSSTSIDIRSDVYALGAIAFLLLTGKVLYDLDGLSLQAALYRIANESREHSVRRLGQSSVRVGGDTAMVLAKSLHTEPDQRYQTAAEMAQDLWRLNTGEPIAARKPSTLYYLRKLVQRNKGATVGAAAGMLLMAGVVVASFLIINHERRIAVTKAATTEEIARFLEDMIASASPNELGKDVTVREAIARGEAILGGSDGRRFVDEPIVEADLRMILGRTHRVLGDELASLKNYQIALSIYETEYGEKDRRTLYAMGRVGVGLRNNKRYEEAIEVFNKALAKMIAEFGPADADTLTTMSSLGILYAGTDRFTESEEIAVRVLEAHRSRGVRDEPLLTAMHNLASLYCRRGLDDPEKLQLGAELLIEAEDGYRDIGEVLPALVSRQLRGAILILQLNLFDAEECLRAGLEESQLVLPEDHSLIKIFLYRLGQCLYFAGEYDAARINLERALANDDKYFGLRDEAVKLLEEINSRE